MNNTLTIGADSITFTQSPVDGLSFEYNKYQPNGRDSEGNYYQYVKSTISRNIYNPTYECQTRDKINELIDFYNDISEGSKNSITWTDHNGIDRTVNFSENGLSWSKYGPNSYSITISLEEVI